MHTFVLSAEVVAHDTLAPFLVEHESLPTWRVEDTLLFGARFDFTHALVERVSELLLRDKITVAGDQKEFTIGDPIRVSQGVYEFWFSWRMMDGDKEPDVVESLLGNGDSGQLYIAGVETHEDVYRRIKDEVRRTRQSLDIEDESLPLEEPWRGFFKIILTVKRER